MAEKSKRFKFLLMSAGGFAIGVINGLLGAGGGMLAVPMLRCSGLKQCQAHSNSVGLILPLSVFSSVLYLQAGRVTVLDALPYVPGGIIGAILGTWLLSKISAPLLRKLFGVFIIWAGVRLLMK